MVEQDKLVGTFVSLTMMGFFVLSLIVGLEVWNNMWSGILFFFIVIFLLIGGYVLLTLSISLIFLHFTEGD